MEKETKLAPLIAFNNHFVNDNRLNNTNNSDEELLVVNSPHKIILTKQTSDKECMTEEDQDMNQSGNTRAMVIGEIPIDLKQMDRHITKTESAHFNISYIDSPRSSTTVIRTPIIPYLVLPFLKKQTQTNQEELQEPTDVKTNELQLTSLSNQLNQDQKENDMSESNLSNVVEREKWSHKTEFLLAIIGFSVDLGNIWRFPKVVYENGGGRFLIPYFVQLAFCGLPLFYMELALGQYHQTGLFTLMEKICPILKGLAFTAFIIDLFMAMFYNTVISWAVYYLVLSIRTIVPWKDCDKTWNTLCCLPINNNLKNENFTLNENKYQLSSDKSYIYKIYNMKSERSSINKRIIIFNNKKDTKQNQDSIAHHAINDLIKHINPNAKFSTDPNQTVRTNYEAYESKINTWIDSYYVLVNDTILHGPKPTLNQEQISKYYFDPLLLTNLIENSINEIYSNQSVNVILNCEKNFNNPTQEFYTRYLTEMHKSTGLNDLGNIKWQMIICLFVVFITVYFALWKGIKSAGKAVWITAIAPYIVMFILLIRGLTLDGSWIGIKFYLSVSDWSSLLEMKVWVDAATQIFFSLGPGFGTIIALSSYNKRTNNCYKDALLTSFINCFTSILSGFVVFSTLGHMAYVQGKTIEEVTEPGPGLIFITYPQAISLMPWAPFWAVVFFFMLFTLGIDSTFGGLESVITGVCDTFPSLTGKRRSWFVLGLIFVCFLFALPTVTHGGPYIVHLFDNFAVAPAILFVVLLEIIGVMYSYGCERFCNDLLMMIKKFPNKFWIYCWKYISPGIVVLMTFMISRGMLSGPLEYGNGYVYTGLGEYIAAILVFVPTSFIIVYAIYRLYKTEGTLEERFKKLTKPKDDWKRNNENIIDANFVDGNIIKMEKLNNAKCIIVNFNHQENKPVNL